MQQASAPLSPEGQERLGRWERQVRQEQKLLMRMGMLPGQDARRGTQIPSQQQQQRGSVAMSASAKTLPALPQRASPSPTFSTLRPCTADARTHTYHHRWRAAAHPRLRALAMNKSKSGSALRK